MYSAHWIGIHDVVCIGWFRSLTEVGAMMIVLVVEISEGVVRAIEVRGIEARVCQVRRFGQELQYRADKGLPGERTWVRFERAPGGGLGPLSASATVNDYVNWRVYLFIVSKQPRDEDIEANFHSRERAFAPLERGSNVRVSAAGWPELSHSVSHRLTRTSVGPPASTFSQLC